MTNNLSDEAEKKILDHINGVAPWTPVLPLKLRLYTNQGYDAAPGTEIVGGSYAPQTIAFGAADSTGMATNTAQVLFSGMPATIVSSFAIYDSAGTRIWYGPSASSRTLQAGDGYMVAAGSLTLRID